MKVSAVFAMGERSMEAGSWSEVQSDHSSLILIVRTGALRVTSSGEEHRLLPQMALCIERGERVRYEAAETTTFLRAVLVDPDVLDAPDIADQLGPFGMDDEL